MSLRNRVHRLLEPHDAGDAAGRWIDRVLILLIVTNVIAVILESLPAVHAEYQLQFAAFDTFSVAIFTIEYVSRVWSCVERHSARTRTPLVARLRYMANPLALIDLIAILPFYFGMFTTLDLRFMRVFRLLRLLKLTRYSPALETVAVVFYQSRRQLAAAAIIMMVLLVFGGSIGHLLEHEAQPDAFGTIPDAMWWAIATLTTVGFGDVTPVTPAGKIFGAILMVLGIGMYALPTGILVTNFAREFRKRDFTVSWRLVASVPLFSHLDAMEIAEISSLLHSKLVPARYTVVRRGETGDAMYFVISGEVEIDIGQHPKRLGPGEHFGEIALLKRTKRVATVTSVTECQLMALEVADLERLIREHPRIHEELNSTMNKRLKEIEDLGITV